MPKYIFKALFLAFISLSIISCSSQQESEKVVIKKSNVIKQVLGVDGMTCMGCEITLEKNVSEILGVVSVKASSDDKQVVVQYDKTKTNLTQIIKTIKKAGYIPLDLIDDGSQ